MLNRPAQTGQPGGGQVPIPGEALLECLVLAARAPQTFESGVVTDQVVAEPLADFRPKLLDRDHPCRLPTKHLLC